MHVVVSEWCVFFRIAWGIYVDDVLITYDNLRMHPSETKMSSIGYMENYTHLGSAYWYNL
jgi:urease accessory protein UreH